MKTQAAAWQVEPVLTPTRRLYRHAMRNLMRGLVGLLADYQIAGADQVPREGPVLVILNHLGLLDGPLLLGTFPRPLEGIVLDQMLQVPVLGQLLRWYGVIPVGRDRFDRTVLTRAEAVLRSGRPLAIAPEAGVSESGALRAARAGAAYLAVQTQVPIIPAAITGTETVHGAWDAPARKLSFRGLENLALWRPDRSPVSIRLTFGSPFTLEDVGHNWREKREAVRAATEQMMARLAALLPPQYQGVYRRPAELPTGFTDEPG